MKFRRSRFAAAIGVPVAMMAGMVGPLEMPASAASTSPTLGLRVLLIGDGASDPTTAAWESALTTEGVPYTEVDATGATSAAGTSTATGSWTLTLPALSNGTAATSGGVGYFNGVVITDSPLDYASGQLSALYSYESSFGVNQVDGYMFPDPSLGATEVSGGALDGTTAELTPAGLTDFPELAGQVPFATGTYGYGATASTTDPYTSLLDNTAGQTLAGIYQHGSTIPGTSTADPQDGVPELSLFFNYNAADIQWLLLAPGLINWVTGGTHLGEYRNYVEMDIDDTFTPDDAWDTTTHEIDYADGDSLRMTPEDVITAAEWSEANHFRLDQLFNFGSTVAYEQGGLDFAGDTNAETVTGEGEDLTFPGENSDSTTNDDPLLAQFQATDPATGKPYADDFGWISHTYDTPYLDVGCATADYIEAELNENTSSIAAAPGTTAGTGGLGITSSPNDSDTYGYEDPQVFVPGNHSGFADLEPGNPATVDEPDLDSETAGGGGSLTAGYYEYAVTDQFLDGAVQPGLGPYGESAAYVTGPISVSSGGSVQLQWQAICHAENYNIYRAPVTSAGALLGSWELIGTYYTPFDATLPDNSSANTTGNSTTNVSGGGEQELTFNDTGSSGAQCEGGPGGYCPASVSAAPWTSPPVTEDAEESPWESNPYFAPALQAAGITAVGADASKPYPDPPDDQFGYGVGYDGPTYAAGQTFLEGTPTSTWPGAQVVPRHPINIYYNASTDAQELDEYNTLFSTPGSGPGGDGECEDSTTTTCETAQSSYEDVVDSVVSQMFDYLLTNNPEPSYVHQTNLIGVLPGCTDTTWASGGDLASSSCYDPPSTACTEASCLPGTADTAGDGTLYSVLDPLLTDYDSYFANNTANTGTTPFVQLTEGQIASVLADQSAWSSELASTSPTVSASETDGTVTVTNTGPALEVPVTVPSGTANSTLLTQYGSNLQYGGDLSGWAEVGTGSTDGTTISLGEAVAPAITSASSATSNVGSAFSFTVTTTGEPAPALTQTAGTLPAGLTFTDNGNGTATIAGTPSAGSGGSYTFTISAANSAGSTEQSFTLTNLEAPTITSPDAATFTTGIDGTYDITTTGYPVTLSETATTFPAGLTFTDNGNGTGSISGTPTTPGSYPVTVTATNSQDDSSASLVVTITVDQSAAPEITSGASADFTLSQMGSVAITATGSPTPSISESGVLPTGLTFEDNGNGTGTLYGAPSETGTYDIAITAANGVSPEATQSFTLVVGQAPAFTSADSVSFALGTPSTFTVTTSGYPSPSFGWSNVPPGMTFVDNENGTATLSGAPTTDGTYAMALSAASAYGTAEQTLDVTVGQVPAITSASSATFDTGSDTTFTVTATGTPTPSFSYTGTLPGGVTFTDNGNGTATLSGTPTATGVYDISLSASNAVGTGDQSFTLTVDSAPSITSASGTTFAMGSTGSTFTVTATGYPTPSFSESGSLPSAVTFVDNGNGTATLAGTAASGTSGTYPVTITASNTAGTATQDFTLTVSGSAPTFTSASSTTFTVGTPGTFSVTTSGSPAPSFSESGALPSGVTFVDNGNGTATLAGTPASGTGGVYDVTITATNASGGPTQSFALTVDQAPAVTSGSTATFAAKSAGSFTVTATGYPTPSFTESGALPSGVKFTNNGNGTATLAGTPAAGTQGAYALTIEAANGVGSNAAQSFTLTVNSGLAITSASTATATAGTAFSFTVTTTGTPTPNLSETGALPSGLRFSASTNGTATISGTPATTDSGIYSFTITAKNSTGTASQAFTLTVGKAPTFSSAATLSETAGTAWSFAVATTGYPTPTLSSGTLPSDVSLTLNANGGGTLAGTASLAAGTYSLTFTATNSVASVNQSFTLTVKAAGTKVALPTFTSASSDAVTAGKAFTFTVTTTGAPDTTYTTNVTHSGTLPAGVSFDNLGNGEATISGTPTVASGGVYTVTLKATNSAGTTTQTFTLTVDAAPTITTGTTATATDGSSFNFTVKATGAPTPAMTESGTLPQGLTWVDNGNGTATLSGTPGVGQGGAYKLTFTAANSLGSASQSFTLTVDQAPAITSASSATAAAGTAFTFTFTSTGYPVPTVTHTGTVAGLTYTRNSNGTAVLAGKPTKAGTYTLTITATNSNGTAAQTFTLTVS